MVRQEDRYKNLIKKLSNRRGMKAFRMEHNRHPSHAKQWHMLVSQRPWGATLFSGKTTIPPCPWNTSYGLHIA